MSSIHNLPRDLYPTLARDLSCQEIACWARSSRIFNERIMNNDLVWKELAERDFSAELGIQNKPSDISWKEFYKYCKYTQSKEYELFRTYANSYQAAYTQIPITSRTIGTVVIPSGLTIVHETSDFVITCLYVMAFQQHIRNDYDQVFNLAILIFTTVGLAQIRNKIINSLNSHRWPTTSLGYMAVVITTLSLFILSRMNMSFSYDLAGPSFKSINDRSTINDQSMCFLIHNLASTFFGIVIASLAKSVNPVGNQFNIRTSFSHIYGKMNQFKKMLIG